MAKELTFSSATLGWRFSHTDIFLRHFIKQWELLQDVALKNLDEYWNLEAAAGNWLQQLGNIFGVGNKQVVSEDAFMLDVDRLDAGDRFLDGHIAEMEDTLYRKIIMLQVASTMRLFSIPNIADNLYNAFGKDQVKVEIIENIDGQGNPKDRYFQLIVTFKDIQMVKLFRGFLESLPHELIGKPMSVSYDVYIKYDPDLGE